MSGIRMLPVKAAFIGGGASLLLTLLSLGLNEISFLQLYERSFAFEPGPWFAEHIAPATSKPNSCIIVGASTAREGFDPGALTKSMPGLAFFNASTTGGNIEVAEIQAQILLRYQVRPKCIIVGLHPFLMMDQNPPFLASTGYLSHLTITGVFSLSNQAAVWREMGTILRTIVLPMRAHADRLNKLVRFWTFELQHRLRTAPLPLSSYEYFKDEFRPGAGAHYDGHHSPSETVAELTQARYRTYTYDRSTTEVSFKRALTLFRGQAQAVIVVSMPTQGVLRELNSRGAASYYRVLGGAQVTHIDCSNAIPDSHFLDDVHLDDDGRRILSNLIAQILPKLFADTQFQGSCEQAQLITK